MCRAVGNDYANCSHCDPFLAMHASMESTNCAMGFTDYCMQIYLDSTAPHKFTHYLLLHAYNPNSCTPSWKLASVMCGCRYSTQTVPSYTSSTFAHKANEHSKFTALDPKVNHIFPHTGSLPWRRSSLTAHKIQTLQPNPKSHIHHRLLHYLHHTAHVASYLEPEKSFYTCDWEGSVTSTGSS